MRVRISGELDISRWDDLQTCLRRSVHRAGVDMIMLDLSQVTYLDAHSAGLIVHAEADARGRGKTLRVAGLPPMPAMVFETLGLDYLLASLADHDGNECHA